MLDINIPEKYRELSERKAAELAGVSRSTFRRRHLEADSPESISLIPRQDGSSFIPFGEVHRLYGELSLENLKRLEAEPSNNQNQHGKIGSEPNDTTQKEPMNQSIPYKENPLLSIRFNEYMDLKTGLASKNAELEQLKKRIEDQKRLLDEAKDRESQEKTRADRFFDELQTSRRLLEDKLKKAEPEPQKINNPLAHLWPPNWFK